MIGIDEAGRGALAGPVVAACVCLRQKISHLNDSKKLSFKKRLEVFENIKKQADFIGIGIVGPRIIDESNILKAVLNADAIIVLTEWDEYSMIDWNLVAKKMPP